MATREEKIVDTVEQVPDAAPDEDKTDNCGEISGEILWGDLVHSVTVSLSITVSVYQILYGTGSLLFRPFRPILPLFYSGNYSVSGP